MKQLNDQLWEAALANIWESIRKVTGNKENMKKKAFINMQLLDGRENMAPCPGYVLVTEGDKITAVAPEKEIAMEDCEIVNLEGRYLMPGLINLHVHIPADGKPRKKPADAKKAVKFATANVFTRKYL